MVMTSVAALCARDFSGALELSAAVMAWQGHWEKDWSWQDEEEQPKRCIWDEEEEKEQRMSSKKNCVTAASLPHIPLWAGRLPLHCTGQDFF